MHAHLHSPLEPLSARGALASAWLLLGLAAPSLAAQGTTDSPTFVTSRLFASTPGATTAEAARPQVSSDGHLVAYNGGEAGTNARRVYLHDLESDERRIVHLTPQGQVADGLHTPGGFSGDGRFLAFASNAFEIVPDDENGRWDVFVHDIETRRNTLVSLAHDGSQGAHDSSYYGRPQLSGDGRYVAFHARAYNLVPDDSNGKGDIFVRDLATESTTRVSVGSNGEQASDHSSNPSISDDGRYVAFHSAAAELAVVPSGVYAEVYVRDLALQHTFWVSRNHSDIAPNGSSTQPEISSNGRYVVFLSRARNLISGSPDGGQLWQVFRYDMQTQQTEQVSVSPSGVDGNGTCTNPSISADGRFVSFASAATNLVNGDTGAQSDVFLRDMAAGLTRRVNVSTSGGEALTGDTIESHLSDDGRRVVYRSASDDLVPNDTNLRYDIFLHDTSFETPSRFCGAKVDSAGCSPRIGFEGLPSLGGPDEFHVTATEVKNQSAGLLFFGLEPNESPFLGGWLCARQPLFRTALQDSGGSLGGTDCSGAFDFHFSQAEMLERGLTPGTAVFCQYWYVDPGGGSGARAGLSDALAFAIGL